MNRYMTVLLFILVSLIQDLNARSILLKEISKNVENGYQIDLSQTLSNLEQRIEEIVQQSQADYTITVKCLVGLQPYLKDLENMATKGIEYCLSEKHNVKECTDIIEKEIELKQQEILNNFQKCVTV